MELLDSYLKAVKIYLPREQKNDIARELSENLLSAIEAREMELGRTLTHAEQAGILKQHGEPCDVARRYQRGSHRLAIGWELIGPELFPTYVRMLGFNLAVSLLATLIIGLIVRTPLTMRLFAIPVIAQVVIMTIIFTGMNYFRNRFATQWLFGPPSLAPWQPVARWTSASGLAIWSVFTLWLLAVPHFPFLIFGPAADGLALTTAWLPFYAPILGLLAIGIVQRILNLAHPEWSWLVPVSRVVVNLAALSLQYPMAKSFPWVAASAAGAADPERYSRLAHNFNAGIQYGVFGWLWIYLLFNGAVYIWLCGPHFRRLIREYREPEQPPLPTRS